MSQIHSSSKNKKAIVTLAVGKRYEIMFHRVAEPSWRKYCEKFSYDMIVITQPLDLSERARNRSPAWQKLLILSQNWSSQYEKIVWLDTDILINAEHSGDITIDIPDDKVCGVEAYSIPAHKIHDIALTRCYEQWRKSGTKYLDSASPGLYYVNRGIAGSDLDTVLQTGVFTCTQKHKEIFEYIYHKYEDIHGSEWNYEMPAMSYELVKNNFVHWLPSEFNAVVPQYISAFYPFLFKEMLLDGSVDVENSLRFLALKNIYEISNFMHFAGCLHMMMPFNTMLKYTYPRENAASCHEI